MSRNKMASVRNDGFPFAKAHIAKRKGNRVRYFHLPTARWSKWVSDPEQPQAVKSDPVPAMVLNAFTVAELRGMAGDRGIKVPSKARKADIIAALTGV